MKIINSFPAKRNILIKPESSERVLTQLHQYSARFSYYAFVYRTKYLQEIKCMAKQILKGALVQGCIKASGDLAWVLFWLPDCLHLLCSETILCYSCNLGERTNTNLIEFIVENSW